MLTKEAEKMKAEFFNESTDKLSSEKANELGKALSNGGISLPDHKPAFRKNCGRK